MQRISYRLVVLVVVQEDTPPALSCLHKQRVLYSCQDQVLRSIGAVINLDLSLNVGFNGVSRGLNRHADVIGADASVTIGGFCVRFMHTWA